MKMKSHTSSAFLYNTAVDPCFPNTKLNFYGTSRDLQYNNIVGAYGFAV